MVLLYFLSLSGPLMVLSIYARTTLALSREQECSRGCAQPVAGERRRGRSESSAGRHEHRQQHYHHTRLVQYDQPQNIPFFYK